MRCAGGASLFLLGAYVRKLTLDVEQNQKLTKLYFFEVGLARPNICPNMVHFGHLSDHHETLRKSYRNLNNMLVHMSIYRDISRCDEIRCGFAPVFFQFYPTHEAKNR